MWPWINYFISLGLFFSSVKLELGYRGSQASSTLIPWFLVRKTVSRNNIPDYLVKIIHIGTSVTALKETHLSKGLFISLWNLNKKITEPTKFIFKDRTEM